MGSQQIFLKNPKHGIFCIRQTWSKQFTTEKGYLSREIRKGYCQSIVLHKDFIRSKGSSNTNINNKCTL